MVRDTSQEDIIKAIINARSRDGATIDDIASKCINSFRLPFTCYMFKSQPIDMN